MAGELHYKPCHMADELLNEFNYDQQNSIVCSQTMQCAFVSHTSGVIDADKRLPRDQNPEVRHNKRFQNCRTHKMQVKQVHHFQVN